MLLPRFPGKLLLHWQAINSFWTTKDFSNSAEIARTVSSCETRRLSTSSPRPRGRPPNRAVPGRRRRYQPGPRRKSARQEGSCDVVAAWDSGTSRPSTEPTRPPAGIVTASRSDACTPSQRLFRIGSTPTRRLFAATSPVPGRLSIKQWKWHIRTFNWKSLFTNQW